MTDVLLALVGTRRCISVVNTDITATMEALDRETIIVTGDAPGVDAHVKRECKRLGFRLITCHARWQTHGRPAGPERNMVIARLANRAIAWPAAPNDTPQNREQSAGTWSCVDLFGARGKSVDVRDVAWRKQ
jgi:hypothetical protein